MPIVAAGAALPYILFAYQLYPVLFMITDKKSQLPIKWRAGEK
jgi:hypothetical protein